MAHIHCIVTGGGLSKDEKWVKEKRKNGNFLFPRRAMEKIYKGYFLERLQELQKKGELKIEDEKEFENMLQQVQFIKWNVYPVG